MSLKEAKAALEQCKSCLAKEIAKDECSDVLQKIKENFQKICQAVLNENALLYLTLTKEGSLKLCAEIVSQDGIALSAEKGASYRKLLCVAFDLAVLRAHLDGGFYRFVFHDGVFEGLDDRNKKNLVDVMREYADDGVQQILTVIESDVPHGRCETSFFTDDEVIRVLHDEGEDGQLFRMTAW